KSFISSSVAPDSDVAMYCSGSNVRFASGLLSNLDRGFLKIRHDLTQNTLSLGPVVITLLFALSSAGNGSSIEGSTGTPLVEYRRFMRDSTLDLSFGRTRGRDPEGASLA